MDYSFLECQNYNSRTITKKIIPLKSTIANGYKGYTVVKSKVVFFDWFRIITTIQMFCQESSLKQMMFRQ